MGTRFPCRVDDEGRMVPVHPERTSRLRGKEVWVETHRQPAVMERSQQANAYLWGVVYRAIALETGNDPDDIHYGLKRLAVQEGVLEPEFISLGDALIEADPTTKTDAETFARYVEWIRHKAEHGDLTGGHLHIPEAGEAA